MLRIAAPFAGLKAERDVELLHFPCQFFRSCYFNGLSQGGCSVPDNSHCPGAYLGTTAQLRCDQPICLRSRMVAPYLRRESRPEEYFVCDCGRLSSLQPGYCLANTKLFSEQNRMNDPV
jgi:hypothetical protein